MNEQVGRWRRMIRAVSLGVVCLALACPTAAWAQANKKKQDEKEPEQSYMLPYILTAVAVLIGLAVVCMPSQRKEEVDMSE
jgi:hypothetical protein